MGGDPVVGISVVSYNTRDLTGQCLDSIHEHVASAVATEVHVVDNGSTDGSAEYLRDYAHAHENCTVHLESENLGFGRANNIALSAMGARYVLLLNSDACFVDGSICDAIGYLDEHPDLFGCGCLLLDERRRPTVSYGRFPRLTTIVRECLSGRVGSRRVVVPAADEPPHSIDFPCGAFYLISRELLTRVGLFDERYFMYYEETDLAARALRAGHPTHYFPGTQAVHVGGASYGALSDPGRYGHFYESMRLFLEEYYPGWHRTAIRLALGLTLQLYRLRAKVLGRDRAVNDASYQLDAIREHLRVGGSRR